MPRKLRIQYPGAMYHVMNRGDQREAIFQVDQDRQQFLATLDGRSVVLRFLGRPARKPNGRRTLIV